MSVNSVINKGFSLTSQSKINTLKHKHTILADGTEVCEHNEKDIHSTENTNVSLNEVLRKYSTNKRWNYRYD